MAKKNNIGLGLAALAVGAGAVAAVTKGHKAEVKKEERKAAVKAAKKDYMEQQIAKVDLHNKDASFLRHALLTMYANPLINYLKAAKG